MRKKIVSIATIGSHSALQILKGARDEGFRTICVCSKDKVPLYKRFNFINEFIVLNSLKDFPSIEKKLVDLNAVVVPHGSFVAYLSLEEHKKMNAKYYGNKAVLEWESNRDKQRQWLQKAGLHVPRQFNDWQDVSCPVIIKTHGAQGGKGYFFAKNKKELSERMHLIPEDARYTIQEYIIGVPLYMHYFYSNLTGTLEILSMDKRYETNVDSLGRIPSQNQQGLGIEPSYVVVGNSPLVLRESLLSEAFGMGERLVEASKKLCHPKGLFGPFCLETVITPEQKFFVIEVSARIVAGTNLFLEGSPYSQLYYEEPMSTGRRIAREIKNALKAGKLEEILG